MVYLKILVTSSLTVVLRIYSSASCLACFIVILIIISTLLNSEFVLLGHVTAANHDLGLLGAPLARLLLHLLLLRVLLANVTLGRRLSKHDQVLHLHRHQELLDLSRVTLLSRHLGLCDLLHDALVPRAVLSEEDRDLPNRLDVAVHVLTLDVDTTMGCLVDLLDLGLLLRLPHGLHHLLLLLL